MCWWAHSAANEGGLLDEGFSRFGLLAADLVEGEEKVVLVRQLCRQLHLHLLVELRGPALHTRPE